MNGLIESVNKLEDAITKALNDTPASLLFDKSLSNGFSEGDKDKETEISIIEAFRENKLTPLYNLTDYYIMLKAFNNDFINEMKDKYNDFKDKTNAQIFYDWVNSFKYEFGNLFPEPESITIDNNTKKLDNLLKLKELGANIADIEAELNEDEIFKNEMDLDGQAPTFTEDDNLDAESGQTPTVDNKIDYNMYRFIDDNKDFDEDKIKRNKKGQFADKNETKDSDNDKKDNKNSKGNKPEIKKIEDTVAIGKANRFIRGIDIDGKEPSFNQKDYAKNLLKELPENNSLCDDIRNRLQNIIDGKKIEKPSKAEIQKAIKSLPEKQQRTASYIYNDKAIAKELYDKYKYLVKKENLKLGETTAGAAKRMVYNDLDNGARAMYGFSSIKEYKRYSKEEDAEIIDLINKNPHPKTTCYRGESIKADIIENLEIGQTYLEINKSDVYSSNASYDLGVAKGFNNNKDELEDGYINVINVFKNTKHAAGYNLSFYSDEDECYIDKREQILYDVFIDNYGRYYLIYQSEDVE